MSVELKLYDTLTREKRAFVPLDSARVRMYVCGPTVYDFAHIGNARPVIVFDVLFRLLRHLYGADKVTYVRNITDVDDRINARAAERGIAIRELTEGTYRNFKEDVAALGCLPPTVEPRATEHIEEMKVLIERLIASGNAYAAEEHVLFSVPSMPEYGKLSKRSLDEMIAGARVDVAPYKRDPMDFVLWKPSKEGEPGWPSPAGIATPGRPGWHIECSAMSLKYLGETFDIHTGGVDNIFPHHENEIAQSEAFTGVPFVRYWLHSAHLLVENEKMAKSAGNFHTLRELLERGHDPRAIRWLLLGTHYRRNLNFSFEGISQATREVARLDDFRIRLDEAAAAAAAGSEGPHRVGTLAEQVHASEEEFRAALADDLNISGAVGAVFRMVRETNAALDRKEAASGEIAAARAALDRFDAVLGILDRTPAVLDEEIDALIRKRQDARKAKDYAESDRIRVALAAQGIVLEDTAQGVRWKRR